MATKILNLKNSKNVEVKTSVEDTNKKITLVDRLWWLAGFALASFSVRFLINLF